MAAHFIPKAKHRSYSIGDTRAIVTASDGTETVRFIGVPEFATRYNLTTSTVIYHIRRNHLIAIKRGYRWWIDMKLSPIPAFHRGKSERVKGSRFSIRDCYVAEFESGNIQFYGPRDIYDPLLDDLGLNKGGFFVFKPNKKLHQLLRIRLVLADGRRVLCQCHPDKILDIRSMIGKAVRGSNIVRVNRPRRTTLQ